MRNIAIANKGDKLVLSLNQTSRGENYLIALVLTACNWKNWRRNQGSRTR
jgi:hypothetical protein